MSDKINLKKMEQKANRLLSQDGLMEILLGAIFFMSSVSFLGSGSYVPFLPIYIIFIRQIVEAFRTRYTYPRVGYVKVPDEESSDVGKGILVFVGAVMLVFVLGIYFGGGLNFDRVMKWLPVGIGFFLTGAFKYNIDKTGDRINLLYMVVTVIGGIGFALMEFNPVKEGTQMYLLFISLFFIIAGITRFISFTKSNPVLEAPSDE